MKVRKAGGFKSCGLESMGWPNCQQFKCAHALNPVAASARTPCACALALTLQIDGHTHAASVRLRQHVMPGPRGSAHTALSARAPTNVQTHQIQLLNHAALGDTHTGGGRQGNRGVRARARATIAAPRLVHSHAACLCAPFTWYFLAENVHDLRHTSKTQPRSPAQQFACTLCVRSAHNRCLLATLLSSTLHSKKRVNVCVCVCVCVSTSIHGCWARLLLLAGAVD